MTSIPLRNVAPATPPVAVPNQTITPIRQLESLHSCQERLGLQLHSLSQKPSSPRAQDIRQRILELFGLTQVDNIGRCVHGVSLPSRGSGMLDTRLDTPPSNRSRHPVPVIAQAAG